MVKLIVGLGNPGKEYEGTRHNMGFEVVKKLQAEMKNQERQNRCRSEISKIRYASRTFFLQMPLTFMNLSGEAVKGLCRQENITAEEVLVVYDCLDLPVGSIRIRKNGSSGGQKGIQSIIDHLGTDKIKRMRIGIGASGDEKVVDYVLGRFSKEDQEVMNQVISYSADACKMAVRFGIDRAMNKFNGQNAIASDGE